MRVAPVIEAVPAIVAIVHRASERLQGADEAQASRLHDALLALTSPRVAERAAAEIERTIGIRILVSVLVFLASGWWRHIQRKVSRILVAISNRTALIEEFRKALPTGDQLTCDRTP